MVYNPDLCEKDYVEEECELYNGGCWKCGTQFHLGEEDTRCPNCNEVVRWNCNSCHQEFKIVDKVSKKKLVDCKVCGYTKCPYCGTCSVVCDKNKWTLEITDIITKHIPDGDYPDLPDGVKKIISYIEDIKATRERKTCFNGMPISYSKGNIKRLMLKMDGFRVRDPVDRAKFVERIKEATALDFGTKIIINDLREDGSYGQEYRDALNLLVCLGKFKLKWLKDKDDKDYCIFKRVDGEPCRKLSKKDLVEAFCSKCKRSYPRGKLYCPNCSWKKGKRKGEMVELKERSSTREVCQLYRGHFKKGNGRN